MPISRHLYQVNTVKVRCSLYDHDCSCEKALLQFINERFQVKYDAEMAIPNRINPTLNLIRAHRISSTDKIQSDSGL